MYNQIVTMLELQQMMNTRVHPHWRDQGFPWYRAIWVECAELLDHYGWKWWKKQSPDMGQVQLEIVDIWHFGLSDLLQVHDSLEDIAKLVQHHLVQRVEISEDFPLLLEGFASNTLKDKNFCMASFFRVMWAANMTFDELYRQYLGKNVLNLFRQSNGYKEGSYRKVWQGREDNQHLVEAIDQLQLDAPDARRQLYCELERRYAAG